MPIKDLLFNFNGRIRRTHYWLGTLGAGFVLSVIIIVLAMIFGGAVAMMVGNGGASGGAAAAGIGMAIIGVILFIALMVLTMWIGLALQIKRWHDRDKPAVYVLINLIPGVGAVWTLVECGFLDGTQGPNQYGPSPKGTQGPAPQAAAVA